MKKKELKLENEQLRKDLRILVTEPNSPESYVIRMQVALADEIEKTYGTDELPDIPKLLGLWGRMMNLIKKEE